LASIAIFFSKGYTNSLHCSFRFLWQQLQSSVTNPPSPTRIFYVCRPIWRVQGTQADWTADSQGGPRTSQRGEKE
jgi:hypothetical protein